MSFNHLTAIELCAEGALTPKEAAKLLGVGHTTLYEMMKSGEIPYAKVRGSRRRIPRLAVIRYLADKLTSGPDVNSVESCYVDPVERLARKPSRRPPAVSTLGEPRPEKKKEGPSKADS